MFRGTNKKTDAFGVPIIAKPPKNLRTVKGRNVEILDSKWHRLYPVRGLLPRILIKANDNDFLGVCIRTLKGSSLILHQILLIWDKQTFPKHPMDYGPVFVLENKDDGTYQTVWDKGHYFTDKSEDDQPQNLTLEVIWPWHSFQPCNFSNAVIQQKGLRVLDFTSFPWDKQIHDLSDVRIWNWWDVKQPDAAKLKIVKHLKSTSGMFTEGYFYDNEPSFLLRNLMQISIMFTSFVKTYTDFKLLVNKGIVRLKNFAQRILSNPGYRSVVVQLMALVAYLEDNGYVKMSDLFIEQLKYYDYYFYESEDIITIGKLFEEDMTTGEFIKRYRIIIDRWEPEVKEVTEKGLEYYKELRESPYVKVKEVTDEGLEYYEELRESQYFPDEMIIVIDEWLKDIRKRRDRMMDRIEDRANHVHERSTSILKYSLLPLILAVGASFLFPLAVLLVVVPILIILIWAYAKRHGVSKWFMSYHENKVSLEEFAEHYGFDDLDWAEESE